MGKATGIQWTDHTFNPWWGCTRVSRACRFCYADTWAQRFGGEYWGQHAPRRFFPERHWLEPLAWNRSARRDGVRRRVFVASMADVFESLPRGHPQAAELAASRERLWGTVEATPWLDWLILTKRPGSVPRLAPRRWLHGAWPANAWLGTSVEDDRWARKRIPLLLRMPAPLHFVSYEPAVGPVEWRPEWFQGYRATGPELLDARDAPRIDWLICGGESGGEGEQVTPLDVEWARGARDVCGRHGVSFFFKQWGQFRPVDDGETVRMERVATKGQAGDLLDGRQWHEVPESAGWMLRAEGDERWL